MLDESRSCTCWNVVSGAGPCLANKLSIPHEPQCRVAGHSLLFAAWRREVIDAFHSFGFCQSLLRTGSSACQVALFDHQRRFELERSCILDRASEASMTRGWMS